MDLLHCHLCDHASADAVTSRSGVVACASCLRRVGEWLARGAVADLREVWCGYSWNQAGDDRPVRPGAISLNVDAVAAWGRDDEGRLVEEPVGDAALSPGEDAPELHAMLASAFVAMALQGAALRHAGAALARGARGAHCQEATDLVFNAKLLPEDSLDTLRAFLFRA